MKIYTLRDAKAGSHNLPWYQKTHGEAERFVKSIISENPKDLPGYYQNVAKYPQDFDLYFLGEFSEGSGKMELLDAPQHMVSVSSLATPNA